MGPKKRQRVSAVLTEEEVGHLHAVRVELCVAGERAELGDAIRHLIRRDHERRQRALGSATAQEVVHAPS